MKQLRQIFILMGLIGLLAIMAAPAQRALAQSDVAYERYDVNITVQADGRFTVQEIQQIRFDGEFTTGFAEIPLAYTNGIQVISVTGGPSLEEQTQYLPGRGAAQTFTQSTEGDSLYVDWEFAPTSPGDTMVFVLEYQVDGGLWIYPEAARLEWRAVPEDRSGLPVPESRVSVTLPTAVAADQLDMDAFGPDFTTEIIDNGDTTTVVFESQEAIADGLAFHVLLDFPRNLVTSARQQWQAEADEALLEYRIDQMDLQIEMQPDGTLHVWETQQVSVQAGLLESGFRHFSLLFTDGIEMLGVSEGDVALSEANADVACIDCYTVETTKPLSWWAGYSATYDEVIISEEAAGEVVLNWHVAPLVAGESTQFTLEYMVEGAVRPTDTEQLLSWTAVSNYDVPVDNVQVTWRLPSGLGLEDVQFSGGEISRAADGAIVVTNASPIPADSSWQIELALPQDATDAAVPAWQRKIEAEMAEGAAFQERQARINLAWLVGEILLGVLAVLGAITYWYLRGSRRLRERLGNYRTEPPSNLPPGVVNYLVEGKMTARGVLASVLHLADLGLVKVEMGEPLRVTAVRQESLPSNSKIIIPSGQQVTVSRFLSQLFNQLLPHLPAGQAVLLDNLLQTLPAHLPDLTKTMAEEMVSYFYGGSSWLAKNKQLLAGISIFVIFGLVAFIVASGVADRLDIPVPIFMFGSVVIWMFVSVRLGGSFRPMKEQTQKEAAKWRGFKAYLSEIQQYGDLTEAQEILDHYFAYAVALGVDDRLVAQIQQLGGHIPTWMAGGAVPQPPVRRTWLDNWQRRLRRGSWRPQPPRPTIGTHTTMPSMPSNGRPALETISDNLSGGLERASNNLAGMLNTAVGGSKDGSPIDIVLNAAGQSVKLNWDGDKSVDGMMSDIMSKARNIQPPRPAAGGGRGGYRSGGSSYSRSRSSSRSSSSRRSGGGGSRGFR
ncbi:MAG: DUF2207 domain-containing protein [Ardenticatenaceae bacterium]|nr:DUF2207 domain-containing protein [Ardenticatenaceae bacterium]